MPELIVHLKAQVMTALAEERTQENTFCGVSPVEYACSSKENLLNKCLIYRSYSVTIIQLFLALFHFKCKHYSNVL